MAFDKLIRQIHLWLGLASGLVVFILGITGCVLAFEEEIKGVVYQDRFFVHESENPSPLPLSHLIDEANEALDGNQKISFIRINNHSNTSYQMRSYASSNVEAPIWYWDEVEHNLNVYIDPYTGNILDIQDQTFEFFYVVVWLHWSLLLTTKIGQPIIGWATIIFVILLITGMVLWWPHNKKALKMRTWFRWKPTTRWKRKNYDLHNIVGFYSMFFALLIALTGLMWSFEWFNNGVHWIANGGKTFEKEEVQVTSSMQPIDSIYPLDVVYKNLQTNHADADIYYIYLPADSTATIGSYVRYADLTKDVSLQFDQYSGELLHTAGKWKDKTNGEKVYTYNYDIHVGAIGGLVGKTIAFFLSLFSASLPVTGFLIWYGRKFKMRKRKPVQRKKPLALQPSKTS